ncbi:hypothetical protein PMAYCL1PPCAC_14662, partial [Pristionchus mayeri]
QPATSMLRTFRMFLLLVFLLLTNAAVFRKDHVLSKPGQTGNSNAQSSKPLATTCPPFTTINRRRLVRRMSQDELEMMISDGCGLRFG